jgi:hypothetical protein
MGTNYFRERHYKEEWTKRIDIALLFQLQAICEQMKKKAILQQDKALMDWASAIGLILATVNGEIVNIKLDDKQLPDCSLQDRVAVAAELPIPNLKILSKR